MAEKAGIKNFANRYYLKEVEYLYTLRSSLASLLMATFAAKIKIFLELTLKATKSETLRNALLRLLYLRKGMHFQGLINFDNHFYILKVDDTYLPTILPYWNVTYKQYLINCQRVSLAYCNLDPGDIVIDIGAGLGEETVVYAKLLRQAGRVYCLEPHPEVFKVLKEVIRLNSFSNVETFPYALFHSNEPISIVDEQDLYESSYISDNPTNKTFSVEAVRFDKFFKNIPFEKIKLLKVNIEGAEKFLLDTDFIPYFKRIEHIAVACHDFRFKEEGNEFFKTKEAVISFFQSNGFKVWHQNTGELFLDDWVYIESK